MRCIGGYYRPAAAAGHARLADRDALSPRNLEPARLAYTARDQAGTVLGAVAPCQLSDAFTDLTRRGLTSRFRLLDFGSTAPRAGAAWPSSDTTNPDRTFRYAVTNLRHDGDPCEVVAEDRQGAIEVTDAVTSVELTIDIWDAHGNHTRRTRTLRR